jgi:sialate O-acetylesterase
MDIASGLFDHMVLQRDAKGRAVVAVAGTTPASGTVLATVRCRGEILRQASGAAVGKARGGRFRACLPGLPVGGPYTIEMKVIRADGRKQDHCVVRDVLVGDLWIAAGQSNMQGCGHLNHPLKPVAAVRAFGMDDRWSVARDPIHNMWEAVDPVHAILCGGANPPKPAPNWGTCPAVSYAQALHAETDVPQGILACAHGGTSMSQWDPALATEQGNRCLYGALQRRLRKNGGRIAGMIWYQGCSDANPDAAPHYTDRMVALIRALRRDAHDPLLPVVIVQIARVTDWPGAEAARTWNSVQEQQRRLPERIRHLAVVPAIDLPLDDGIHVSEAGQVRLGRRLAYAMRVLTAGRKAGFAPIALAAARVLTDSFGRGVIEVRFDNVVGRLTADGCRPTGFSLEGAPPGTLFDVALAGPCALLRTGVPAAQAAGWRVWYGRGVDPYCNLTDGADRAVPVFGPLPVGAPRALLPPLDRALVSPLLPGAGTLEGLEPPPDLGRLGLTPRNFGTGFLNLRPEIAATGDQDLLAYYVLRFSCPEAMRLALSLGYDGPMKAWLDRAPLADDPAGVNPCVLDKRRPVVTLAAGKHELVVALGTNHGRAWGIMVQVERLDVPRAVLRRGDPSLYRMPVFEG